MHYELPKTEYVPKSMQGYHKFDESVSRRYRFRTPYDGGVMDDAFLKAGAVGTGNLLDLCTGQGEIVSHLKDRFLNIRAVDGSREMLKLAPSYPNVAYEVCDINSMEWLQSTVDARYDAMTVGRGVHWLSDETLNFLFTHTLAPGGTFFSFESGLDKSNPWLARFARLVAALSGAKWDFAEYSYADRMRSHMMEDTRVHQATIERRIPWKNIAEIPMSQTVTADGLSNRQEEYQSFCERLFEPVSVHGLLTAKISLTCHFARRTGGS